MRGYRDKLSAVRIPTKRALAYRRRRSQLAAIKLERGCIDCGYNAHPAALQFDHREPGTRNPGWDKSMASNATRNWNAILAEIAKCDVRCANCHAIRTFEWVRSVEGGGMGRASWSHSIPIPPSHPTLFDR